MMSIVFSLENACLLKKFIKHNMQQQQRNQLFEIKLFF